MHIRIRMVGLIAGPALLFAVTDAPASVESELAFHRGVVAYGEERLGEARAEFERVLEEDPEDTAAIHYLALIAQAQGDPDQAIALYRRSLALAPDDSDIRFDLGTALLEAGRTAEAREAFALVIAAQPDRARAHLFAGIAAYRAGAYAEAVPHLDRAVELDPSLRLHARYYTGLSQALLGDLPGAEGAFAEVEQQSPLHPLARSARSLREQVEAYRPERRWSLSVTAGIEWDSNPIVAGEAVEREDDVRGVWLLRGRMRAFENEWLTLTGGYDGYISAHFDETDVDLQTHVGWASAAVNLDPVQLGFRYDYAHTWIDLSDNFHSLHRLTPSATVREGSWGVTQLYYQWQDMEFLQGDWDPALDRDGDQHSVGLNQFFFPPAPVSYLRVGALGDFFDPEGSEYRYDAFEVSAGAGVELPFDVQFDALYRFIRRYFQHPSIFEDFGKRDDFVHRVNLELERPIGDHWEVSLLSSFTFDDSDIQVFDYDRYIVGGYLTYRF